VAVIATDKVFTSDCAVLFGAAPALDVVIINDYALTAVTPPNEPGPVNVMLVSERGEIDTMVEGFTYTAVDLPPVTALSASAATPDSGPVDGLTEVTIVGTGFTDDTAVLFDGTGSTGVTFVNELVLIATTPVHEAGTVDISLRRPDGETATLTDAFTYVGVPDVPEEDLTLPRVVNATSLSNTTVLVSFSEPMSHNAVDPVNYLIAQPNVVGEAGALTVTDARFVDGDRSAVHLITLSQSLVQYDLYVMNMTDMDGNPFAPRQRGVDPTMAIFWGTGPTGGGTDTDGDGLTDDIEQRGWVVHVVKTGGAVVSRDVTSDPLAADTDSDGLNDTEEFRRLSDPRNRDTDGDTVKDYDETSRYKSSLTKQDSDGDRLDDAKEIGTLKTSPILADTDGDGLDDRRELMELNRDPRVSDIPTLAIVIGNLNLAMDTRFTYTNAEGTSESSTESVSTTLRQSENQTYSTSDQDSWKAAVEASNEFEIAIKAWDKGGGVSNKFKLTVGFEKGHTSTFGTQSSESAEEAYNESLVTAATHNVSRSVTRQVVGATMLADVTIQNLGDTAFTVDNVELSAVQQSSRDRTEFIPLASLTPQSDLGAVNLGPLVPERGPFVFSASQVYPAQVEDLLKNPRGLIVRLANFDVTDELGRNFAFTSQEIFDRTAGISIDYGDGRTESYRVATASEFDSNNISKGITMAYALQDILGLAKDAPSGYATSIVDWVVAGSCNASSTNAGDPCYSDDECTDGKCLTVPVEILTRVKDVEAGMIDDPSTPPPGSDEVYDESRKFWLVYSSQGLDPSVDFDDLPLKAGYQYAFTFSQDKDADRVYAREEFLYGSSDKNPNTDGCPDDDPATPEYDGSCDERTVDTLSDLEEIKEGWLVEVEGRVGHMTYPDPVQPDSDGDRLLDHEERDCGLDARQRDTDVDGLSDYEEFVGFDVNEPNGLLMFTVPVYAGGAVIDGGDGVRDTAPAGDDQIVGPSVPGGLVIGVGANGVLDTTIANNLNINGDDFIAAVHSPVDGCLPVGLTVESFATDPRNADTDADGIIDGAEIELGINPNNPLDGARYRDADRDGVPDAWEEDGFVAIVNGVEVRLYSDPYDPDSDDDRLPDLLEHALKSNPQSQDTDGDGISDFDECDAGNSCVTSPGVICGNFVGAYADFEIECLDAENCLFLEIDLDTFGSQRTGTNLNEADTDHDGMTDPDEFAGYQVTCEGSTWEVFPDPFDPDSDNDGWNDGTERSRGTDATEPDTDQDQTNDPAEVNICAGSTCRNPLVRDQKIKVEHLEIDIDADCDEWDWEDMFFQMGLKRPQDGDDFIFIANQETLGYPDCGSAGDPHPCVNADTWLEVDGYTGTVIDLNRDGDLSESFIAPFGATFEVAGGIQEIDGFPVTHADAGLIYSPNPCVGCPWPETPDISDDTSHTLGFDLRNESPKTISFSRSGGAFNHGCGEFDTQSWTFTVTLRIIVDDLD